MRKRLILAHKVCHLLFNQCRFYGSRKLGRIFSKWMLPPLDEPILCPTIFNFDLCLSQYGGHEIYYLGFYEIGTLNIIQKCLRPNDVFIDVGSSMGLMSLTASLIVGNAGLVLAFEPDERRFSNLLNSIHVNKRKNIKSFNIGLGQHNEIVALYKNRHSPSMVKMVEGEVYEKVEIDALDHIIEKHNIPQVKFLKIDVEGFELDVLKGSKKLLSKSNAPILCIEYFIEREKNQDSSENIFDFIKNINNYTCYQCIHTSNTVSKLKRIHQFDELNKQDNLYCFLDHHLQNISEKLFLS